MRCLKINPVLTKAHLLSIRKGPQILSAPQAFVSQYNPYPTLTLQWFLPSMWPLGGFWLAKSTVYTLLWLSSVWVNFDGWQNTGFITSWLWWYKPSAAASCSMLSSLEHLIFKIQKYRIPKLKPGLDYPIKIKGSFKPFTLLQHNFTHLY